MLIVTAPEGDGGATGGQSAAPVCWRPDVIGGGIDSVVVGSFEVRFLWSWLWCHRGCGVAGGARGCSPTAAESV